MTNWQRIHLGEFLRRSTETTEIQPEESYNQITVKLWGKGVVLRGILDGSEMAGSRRFLAREGQLILSRIDARNGAIGIVPASLDRAVVTNDFPLFALDRNHIQPTYFEWLTKMKPFVDLCQKASEGTTNRVRLQEDRFLTLQISLPPLPEQRRIVGRIEELAAKINEARGLRQKTLGETEALITSKTSKIFEGLMTGPRQPIRSLGEGGFNPIQIGPFGAQLHRSDFVEAGVPVLNVGNVWPEGLRLDYLDQVTEEKAKQLERYSIRTGDLLFARSGATLGKVCLVTPQCDGWLMTGHLFRVRFDPKRVFNCFAFAALRRSPQIQEQVFGQVRGATRPGYNTTLLGMVELPVPPLCEQRRIVVELDALQAQVDALKKLQAETTAELDALLPSILDKAFKGEL